MLSLTGTARGVGLMLFATVCFVALDTCAKVVAQDLPPFEAAFFRNLFGLLMQLPFLLRAGLIRTLRTSRLRLHALRALIQGTGMLAFFTGLTLIPLAEVTALSFSAPLFGSVLAVLVLGERIRIRRITALAVGFLGVLIVLRPGFEEVGLGAALILAASLGWGGAIVVIKILGRTESSFTQIAYMNLALTAFTLVPALFVWQAPAWEHYFWFVLIGLFGTAGHIAFAEAVRHAEMSALLPLDFLRLAWASLMGFLVFAEVPDPWSWVGGAVIFASATYIAFREAYLSRQRRAAAARS